MLFNLSEAKSIIVYAILEEGGEWKLYKTRVKKLESDFMFTIELYKKNVSFPMTILSSLRLRMEALNTSQ